MRSHPCFPEVPGSCSFYNAGAPPRFIFLFFCTRLLLLQQSCKAPGLLAPPPHTHPKQTSQLSKPTNKTRLWLLLLQCKIQAEKGGLKPLCPSQTCIEQPLQASDGANVATIQIPAPSPRNNAICLGQTWGIGPGLREGPQGPGPVHIEPERGS